MIRPVNAIGVRRPLVGAAGLAISVSLIVASQPAGASRQPTREVAGPLPADSAGSNALAAQPGSLTYWWQALSAWVDLMCGIVLCDDGPIDPLMPASAMTEVDPDDVLNLMYLQVERYAEAGLIDGLTETEKTQAVDNIESTRNTILEHPEEIPQPLLDDYLLLLDNAAADLTE